MLKRMLLMAFVLSLCLHITLANSVNYEIKDVAVNGIFLNDDSLALQLGENLQIDVWVKGLSNLDNVKVKAWIATNEISDIYAETEPFDVQDNVVYRKELYLEIPKDLSLEDNNFKLYIEVYDKTDYVQKSYSVFLNERMHDIVVQDVIVRPNTMLDAGANFVVQARLENLGSKKERNIKVEATIPGLGVNAVTWVDALESHDEDGSSVSTSFIPLFIPKDAVTGDYQLKVKVKYNKLNSETVETRLIYVKGVENDLIDEKVKESLVSVSINNELELDKVSSYKVAIANIGNEKKSYKVEVASDDDWAEIETMPSEFELMPGTGTESVINVKPVKPGKFKVNIKVYDSSILIKEVMASVNVHIEEKSEFNGLKFPESLKDNRNKVLAAMIIVLIIALYLALRPGLKPHPDHKV